MAYPVRSVTFFINITSMFINKGGTTIYDYSSLTGTEIQNPVRDFFVCSIINWRIGGTMTSIKGL